MSASGDPKPGLSWPDHDTGPTPPPEYRDPRFERPTRRPLAFWDRIKFLVLLGGAWFFMFWNVAASNPKAPMQAVFAFSLRAHGWLLLLAGCELLRQLHYLISEQSPGYHHFWTEDVFGGFNRWTHRYNDWTRFRIARLIKWLFILFIVDLIVAKVISEHPVTALFRIPIIIFQSLPFFFQLFFAFFYIMFQFVGLFWFLSRGGTDVYFPEDIKTRFTDVWGQDQVLEKVKENIIYLEAPEAIEEKGGYVPGGILLWGPPGTGKTLMAEAVAGETGKPFVFVDPGAFINMFMGIGILKVKSLFRKLRKLALRYGGVIVFFDEADALGNRGQLAQGDWRPAGGFDRHEGCNGLSYLSPAAQSLVFHANLEPTQDPQRRWMNAFFVGGAGGGGGMGTLQALLTEISGLKKPRGFFNRVIRKALGMRPKPPPKYRILTMMATNMPSALDEALLRPGRIDRIYKVGYPSKAGRIKTYEGYLAKVRHDLTADEVDKLATITPYATGASIKDLVNEALINSIREGREWITWKDIIKAKHLKALGPSDDFEYIERERHAVAIHEACHAVVAYRVRHHYLSIDIATIERRGDIGGFVASIPVEERFMNWKSEEESDIMVALASLAGERMFFEGDNTSGVTGDLHSATSLAMLMEGYWGMGRSVGSQAVVKRSQMRVTAIADTTRSLLESDLGRRIEQMLQDLLERTRRLLEENRLEVLAVAHALETYKTLTGDDVEAIIEGGQGPLVDGRPYRTPEFAAAAEAYHLRAVEAHKRHGKVDAQLPVLGGGSPSFSVAERGA